MIVEQIGENVPELQSDIRELLATLADERRQKSDLQKTVNQLETDYFKALAKIREMERDG